jgi:hypothetical protein
LLAAVQYNYIKNEKLKKKKKKPHRLAFVARVGVLLPLVVRRSPPLLVVPCVGCSPVLVVPCRSSFPFPVVRHSLRSSFPVLGHSLPFDVPRCSSFPAVRCSPPLVVPHQSLFPSLVVPRRWSSPPGRRLSLMGLVPAVRRSPPFVVLAIRRCQHLHTPLRAVARRRGGGAM